MAKMYWYTKEFSELTSVTLRTLYHYDRIGLLIPSVRLHNNYRKYSELDLLKLQQIIALKSFGFELSQIKGLISKKINLSDHLNEQVKFLEEKASSLISASKVLKSIIAEDSESINWEQTLMLIEVYRMIEQLKNTWIGKVLNDEELKQYAELEQELANRGQSQRINFNKKWDIICQEIKDHINDSPSGDIGIKIAQQTHEALQEIYGSKFAGLKHAVWEKVFQSGANQSEDNHGLSMTMVNWLDRAMSAYWQDRNQAILKQIGKVSDDIIITEFTQALVEMFGYQADLKRALLDKILSLEEVPEKSKQWIKKYFNQLI